MGYLRIRGELLNFGIDVSATTISAGLRQGDSARRHGGSWMADVDGVEAMDLVRVEMQPG